jgi:hypothetical protein
MMISITSTERRSCAPSTKQTSISQTLNRVMEENSWGEEVITAYPGYMINFIIIKVAIGTAYNSSPVE